MTATPKGFRLHIGIFGRRNVGKSTLLNLVAGQEASIVSPTPGTTTDPVEKAMEFIPMGPVLWIDTAGIDDAGDLGGLRSDRARRIIDRTDLAILVFHREWGAYEQDLFAEFQRRRVPVVIVANKADLDSPGGAPAAGLPPGAAPVRMAAERGDGLEDLRQAILASAPADFINSPVLLRDLFKPGECLVLVTPIDKEAPKGRMILPQVQALRDVLDGDGMALICKETGLAGALEKLEAPPALVVTDSQAIEKVAAIVPEGIPVTGFSILYARAKGDLAAFARGAAAIDRLRDGDVVLVAESCTHHQEDDDIGRVKLPAWIRGKCGAKPEFRFLAGHDFPEDLSGLALVLHCGACMTNRRAVLSRIARCQAAGKPIVNYGIAIAYCRGLLERALAPFPEVLAAYRAGR
ncbi:MAG: [FeFe] hydrogenase H-cluster maturation GTPase HydF [Planctomycetota bacterium]|jgi:[FeFe] hydrogenase H-cluster maturation GTPase HydF|nr:[FeFe] hydrogenase H-cluster maturation GTPase HydF [Planctomycetota bacterium]